MQGTLIDPGFNPDPFYRWAGNKRKQIKSLLSLLGPMRAKQFRDPFLGAGGLPLRLLCDRAVASLRVSDTNGDLIATWQGLHECPAQVIAGYKAHRAASCEEYYYQVRAQTGTDLAMPERAARFLYLLCAGHCGLWRENLSGKMNTPYGHVAQVFTTEERLWEVAKILRAGPQLTIVREGFEGAYDHVGPRIVIYADPPYLPLDGQSFIGYQAGGFTVDQHKILAERSLAACRAGATALVSNHDTELAREIYAGAKPYALNAKRGYQAGGKAREVIFVYAPGS